MNCPACARPIAMARASCVYCGAALSDAVLEAAALASRRVLRSSSIADLETVAKGLGRDQPRRRYLVLDTEAQSAEIIAQAFSVSLWDARQWRGASRYRLIKISAESPGGTLESGLSERGINLLAVSEATVARLKEPLFVASINPSAIVAQCVLRDDEEGPAIRKDLRDEDVALIVSGPIRREKVKEATSLKTRTHTKMEEAWLVHLYLKGESRPWEIDPRRTGFEETGLASAHLSTMELVRRLAKGAPHDEGFRNIVPALSPGVDPLSDLDGLGAPAKKNRNQAKAVFLDNVMQFHEYSAWRGAVEMGFLDDGGRNG